MHEGKSTCPIDPVIAGETNTNTVDRGSRSFPMIVGLYFLHGAAFLPVIFPVFQPFSPGSSVCYCLKKHLISASETEVYAFLRYKKKKLGGRIGGKRRRKEGCRGNKRGNVSRASSLAHAKPRYPYSGEGLRGGREGGNIRRELR